MDVVPGVTRLFILHNPDDNASVQSLADLQQVATNLGIELIVSEVRDSDEVALALESMPEDVDAFFALPFNLVALHFSTIVETAIEQQIPMTGSFSAGVQGALMVYGPVFTRVGRQASRLAAKILEWADPADLPVDTAEFFLVVNLKTAEAIGVDVPEVILQQADEIIR